MPYIGAGIQRFNTADGLTVSGTTDLDGAVVVNESSADADFRVESNGNANMLFVDASADKVGVGTNSPSESIHCTGAVMSTGVATTAVASSATVDFTSGEMRLITRGADTSTRGGLKVVSQASNGGSSLDPLVIDTSGKVGVGETAPLGTLHVRTSDASLSSVNANADDLILENNGNCGMSICSSTSGEGNINFIDSGDTNIGRIQYTHSDNNMIFRCNDVERARFQGDGDFLINTTSQLSDGKVSIAATLTTRTCATMKNNSTQGAGHTFIRFTNNSDAIAGSIQHTGTTTTSYGTSSDYRLKENVADMTGAIARVKALAPKRFNFIADADTTVDGFLAHEAQTVVPEAVMGTHNEVDDDNNPIMQQIDHSKLVPLLTAALKESITKIETLETEMTALKARVTALEDA